MHDNHELWLKASALKFSGAWAAFALIDHVMLEAVVDWLRVVTHVFLAGGSVISFLLWVRKVRANGKSGDH